MDGSDITSTIERLIEQGSRGQSEVLDDAIRRTRMIEDGATRDWYLGKIIRILVQATEWDKAADVAAHIQHPLERKEALVTIASSLVAVGRVQQAKPVLDEAEKTTSAIVGEQYWLWQKAEALDQIALLRSRVGEKGYATALWEQAIEIAQLGQRDVSDPQEVWDSSGVLAEIARNLALAGCLALAKTAASAIRIEKKRQGALDIIASIESGQQ